MALNVNKNDIDFIKIVKINLDKLDNSFFKQNKKHDGVKNLKRKHELISKLVSKFYLLVQREDEARTVQIIIDIKNEHVKYKLIRRSINQKLFKAHRKWKFKAKIKSQKVQRFGHENNSSVLSISKSSRHR